MFKNKKYILIAILVVAAFLRLYKLESVPVSMFGDELDVGYHAYSILKTGKDYSGNAWPLHFQSLAEWRTPLYLYSAVPTVALFGISPLSVRLPAAIFGLLGVYALYLFVNEATKNEKLALISTAILAFSPWHIQYSRAAFEVTQMLFFLLMGLYLFYKSLDNGKFLWLSVASFLLMPWDYSTAKIYTPFFLLLLFVLYFKKIIKYDKKYLIRTVIAGLLLGGPLVFNIFFGGGAQRFGYVSVFSDPTTETTIGVARENDAHVRGETGSGLSPTIIDRIFHNKFELWGAKILNNYFQPFSADFLFNNGDPNLRHSIQGMGEFYKVEALILLIGFAYLLLGKEDKKFRWLLIGMLLLGPIPAALTRDGGNHATRLILLLPVFVVLMAFGFNRLSKNNIYLWGYLGLFAINFVIYQHLFWAHNPWYSERWWHYGWREAVQSIKVIDQQYQKVVITSADEPPWIFFAAQYEYPPDIWHTEYPIGNDIVLDGFGKISHTGKFYFGTPEGGLYDWGKVLDDKTLYLASAKEVNVNLIAEPERTPNDIKVLKSIAYPSGEPAFYLITGISNEENSKQ